MEIADFGQVTRHNGLEKTIMQGSREKKQKKDKTKL